MTREAENELFVRWQQARNISGFVRDGAGIEFWRRTRARTRLNLPVSSHWRANLNAVRILFILKEANDSRRLNGPFADWDIRDSIDHAASNQTLKNLSRWAAHILHGACWENVSPMVDAIGDKAVLRQVAYLNLKKTPGGAVAQNSEIRRHACRDGAFIKEQISLYQPHLTVACGTFSVVEEIYDLKPEARTGTDPCHLHRHHELGTMVSFWHPQARKSSEWLFRRFVAAVETS